MSKLLLMTFLVLFSCGEDLKLPSSQNLQRSAVIYMWLSTTTSSGDLGGRSGADSICESDSSGIALPSGPNFTHRAVIATSTYHPRNLIDSSDTREVRRPDGTVIVNLYSDFHNSSINSISTINSLGRAYWSGLSNSANISSSTCMDWTSSSNTDFSLQGRTDLRDRGRYSNGTLRQCRTGGGNQIAILCLSY